MFEEPRWPAYRRQILGLSLVTVAYAGEPLVSCDWTCVPPVEFGVRKALNGGPTEWFLRSQGISVSRSWQADRGARQRQSGHPCWKQTLSFRSLWSTQRKRALGDFQSLAPLALVQFGNVSTVLGGSLPGHLPWTLRETSPHSQGGWRQVLHFACPGGALIARATITEIAKDDLLIRRIDLKRPCAGWAHVAVNIAAVPSSWQRGRESSEEL